MPSVRSRAPAHPYDDAPSFVSALRSDPTLLDGVGLLGIDAFIDRNGSFFSPSWPRLLIEFRQVVSQAGGRASLDVCIPELLDLARPVLRVNVMTALSAYLETQVSVDRAVLQALGGSSTVPQALADHQDLSASGQLFQMQYAATLAEFIATEIAGELPAQEEAIMSRYYSALDAIDPPQVNYSASVLKQRLPAARTLARQTALQSIADTTRSTPEVLQKPPRPRHF